MPAPRRAAPAEPVAGELSAQNVGQLVHALARVPGAHSVGTRDLWERELRRAFPGFSFPRGGNLQTELFQLVRACEDRPGSAQHLLGVIAATGHAGSSFDTLRTLVNLLLPAPIVVEEEQQRVLALVSVAGPAVMAAVVADVEELVGPNYRGDLDDPVMVCRWLARLGAPPGEVPPLLRFVDRLAHELAEGDKRRLHAWIDLVAKRLELSGQSCLALCVWSEERRHRHGDHVFTAWLEPYASPEQVVLRGAWLERGGTVIHRFTPRAMMGTPAQALARIGSMIEAVPRYLPATTGPLPVELIVPRSLMHLSPEKMTVDVDGFVGRLGTRYPVVFRSYERLKAYQNSHAAWREKWRLLTDAEAGTPVDVHWVDRPGVASADELYAILARSAETVAVAIAFPPESQVKSPAGCDEITVALHAGMPLIMWCQDENLADRFRREMEGHLTADGLRRMPELALELRQEAVVKGGNHVGAALSVLWDDPTRIPALDSGHRRVKVPEGRGVVV